MKAHILVIIRLLLLWLVTFALAKFVFMFTCAEGTPVTVADYARVWWHGLPMDLSTSAYLLLVPWLCLLVHACYPHFSLRKVLIPYQAVAALVVVSCLIVDMALYPFWGFKLDATIFTYIDHPSDALASVSRGFVLVRIVVALLLTCLLVWFSWLSIPASTTVSHRRSKTEKRRGFWSSAVNILLLLLVGSGLFVMLRGGVTESTMNVGNAYFSTQQFLNHSAVNPVFSLLSSSRKSEHFDQLYRQLPEAEADRIFNELYTPENLSDVVEKTDFPNILLIVWEGCGGQFTEAIGGQTDVVPNLDALIGEGLFFSQLRANSFRTDRGLLSILSGHVSYPTHSLMKMATKAARLPSIARTLHGAGYENTFVYGGDVNFTNMKGYLLGTGYDHIIADKDFSLAERSTSKWGVCDSILFERLWTELQGASPWFVTALTLSSHEPWDVSGRRHSDPKLNAFAYTDAQLGRFMRRLKDSPLWDNTLVIILPDHGVLAGSVSQWQDPRFFHIPMVWTGGALQGLVPSSFFHLPSSIFYLPCSQSDLAATLLGTLGLPHADFPWSRDVFNPAYARYPFTYSTFVDGFAFTDSTGTTIFDNVSRHTLFSTTPQGEVIRRMRGQALQQKSYELLERL